ncbi:hypothetical protein CfE428DRAFT_4311 [Chthoniobacter flavus Ellin428]|uniref:Uncharacterized protein n=1 Tax=Chthoniobacter flavus Ellin428 TaxID=497964 RepID=B4D5X2_9BACT|nr:hypothetical protein CfE428DRAFT_4311 [Chthoniobacter flavus Ellin428]
MSRCSWQKLFGDEAKGGCIPFQLTREFLGMDRYDALQETRRIQSKSG